jgi:hypothetical protein
LSRWPLALLNHIAMAAAISTARHTASCQDLYRRSRLGHDLAIWPFGMGRQRTLIVDYAIERCSQAVDVCGWVEH